MAQRTGATPKRVLLIVISLGVAAAITAVVMVSSGGDGSSADATPTSTSTGFPSPSGVVQTVAPAAPFTAADADRITTALNSGDDAAISAILVPEFREAFDAGGGEVLPAGSTAALLDERFVAIEPGLASVPVVVSGERAGNFLLLLSYLENQWLVLGTESVE